MGKYKIKQSPDRDDRSIAHSVALKGQTMGKYKIKQSPDRDDRSIAHSVALKGQTMGYGQKSIKAPTGRQVSYLPQMQPLMDKPLIPILL